MISKTTDFVRPDVTDLERAAFLVGYPIAHSSSPALHHGIYTALGKHWGQRLCETTDLAAFISYMKSEPRCMGSGVTMPFKVAVIPFLDELTPEAEAIGAVNTIFFKIDSTKEAAVASGSPSVRYCGTNTDCVGIRDAFLNNLNPQKPPGWYRGRPALVVGGGGTCRAAVYSLQKFMGCSPIYIVNRDTAEVNAVIEEYNSRRGNRSAAKHDGLNDLIHVATVEQASELDTPGLIVSAVPDFPPVTENEKTARAVLEYFLVKQKEAQFPAGALLEMCYHPSPNTEISQLAFAAGWQVIGGIEAMIGQGLAQASLWADIHITNDLVRAARRTVQERLELRPKH